MGGEHAFQFRDVGVPIVIPELDRVGTPDGFQALRQLRGRRHRRVVNENGHQR